MRRRISYAPLDGMPMISIEQDNSRPPGWKPDTAEELEAPMSERDDLRERLTRRFSGENLDESAADLLAATVLAEIERTHYVVERGRWERARQWAEYAARANDRGRFTREYRPIIALERGDLDE